nr:MAG TPA: hypothetical protein [Caudoviricetes sp.]
MYIYYIPFSFCINKPNMLLPKNLNWWMSKYAV